MDLDPQNADKADKGSNYQRQQPEIIEEEMQRETIEQESQKRLEEAQTTVKKKLPVFYILTSIVLFVLFPLFVHWFSDDTVFGENEPYGRLSKWIVIFVVMWLILFVKREIGFKYYDKLGKTKGWYGNDMLLSFLCAIECYIVIWKSNNVSSMEKMIVAAIFFAVAWICKKL